MKMTYYLIDISTPKVGAFALPGNIILHKLADLFSFLRETTPLPHHMPQMYHNYAGETLEPSGSYGAEKGFLANHTGRFLTWVLEDK